MAATLAEQRGLSKETCRVLDLGCGTGLVGEALARKGFKNIVGLDISPEMIKQAAAKGVYAQFVEHDLTQPDQLPTELRSSFDLVCGAGIVNNNHMDESLFEHMMIAAKKSGLIVFASRFSYIGQYWYNSVLQKLEDENRLRPIK